MATVTIDVPDAVLTRVLDAVAAKTGWASGNGFTKAQWAKKQLAEYAKNLVVAYEADTAGDVAYTNQLSTSQSELNIT